MTASWQNHIALFYPWPNIDSVPSLCNAIELLAANGFNIDLFTMRHKSAYLPPSFDGTTVKTFWNYTFWKPYRFYRLFPKKWFVPLFAKRRHMKHPYCCLIGVDPEGLHHASEFNQIIKVPVIYYSLELLLSSEIPKSKEDLIMLKEMEKKVSRKSEMVIIQDEQRANLLMNDNDLSEKHFYLVPNSPLGSPRRRKSDFWRNKFGMSPDKKIVLYAGTFSEINGIEKIAGSVQTWPENWVFVIHTRHAAKNSYAVKILKEFIDPSRVFISDKPVTRKEYLDIVDGADIGIAFYIPEGNSFISKASRYHKENIKTIGLSSGKIASYLHSGLPVIVNRSSTLGTFIKNNGCGVSVKDEKEISEALVTIETEYDKFSELACKTFDDYLDFEQAFQKVIDQIEILQKNSK